MILLALAWFAGATPEDTWTALAQREFQEKHYCEAFFYAKKSVDSRGSSRSAYMAFLAAFYADQNLTAFKLYSQIHDPTLLAQLDGQKIRLDQLAETGLKDAACPAHVPICGDLVLDVGEQCDDGNQMSGDGCTMECRQENAPTAPASVLPVAVPSASLSVATPSPLPTPPSVGSASASGGAGSGTFSRLDSTPVSPLLHDDAPASPKSPAATSPGGALPAAGGGAPTQTSPIPPASGVSSSPARTAIPETLAKAGPLTATAAALGTNNQKYTLSDRRIGAAFLVPLMAGVGFLSGFSAAAVIPFNGIPIYEFDVSGAIIPSSGGIFGAFVLSTLMAWPFDGMPGALATGGMSAAVAGVGSIVTVSAYYSGDHAG
jgi:cysteine-rich repeat protein